MHLLILGAGGIGGYLAARMSEAGLAPRLLVRQKRASNLQQHGLRLESPLGNWCGLPELATDAKALPDADFIFLSCKAYDLASALETVSPCVSDATIIVPFLNGVRHIEAIRARFPECSVWGGVAHLGVKVGPDGSICHFNDMNRFSLGPLHPDAADERAALLIDKTQASPIELRLRADVQQDMWDKLVFLGTLAGMTCLMRANVGTILATVQGEDLILQLLDECTRIAEAEDFLPEPAALDEYRKQLTDRSSQSTASMLRDIASGTETEADHILGDLSERAARHALRVPLLRTCLSHLQAYELGQRAAVVKSS